MGSVRGDRSIGNKIIEASDNIEKAYKDISLWFKEEELIKWSSHSSNWVYE